MVIPSHFSLHSRKTRCWNNVPDLLCGWFLKQKTKTNARKIKRTEQCQVTRVGFRKQVNIFVKIR